MIQRGSDLTTSVSGQTPFSFTLDTQRGAGQNETGNQARERVTVLAFHSRCRISAFKLWMMKRRPHCTPPEAA